MIQTHKESSNLYTLTRKKEIGAQEKCKFQRTITQIYKSNCCAAIGCVQSSQSGITKIEVQ